MSPREIMGVQVPSDRPEEHVLRTLKVEVARIDERLDAIEERLAKGDAANRSDTIKTICAAVVSVVTAVAGSRLLAPEPPPSKVVVQRSAYDRHLEFCKSEPDGAARVACLRLIIEREADTR